MKRAKEDVRGSQSRGASSYEDTATRYGRLSRDYPQLSRAEEHELARKARLDGDRAAEEQLVLHNVRLVIHQALRHSKGGLSLEDLIQEGMIGLMRAAKDFDDRMDNRFSTYAMHWINQSFMRYKQRYATSDVRVPTATRRKYNAIAIAGDYLEGRRGTPPSSEEVAKFLDLNVEDVLRWATRGAMTVSSLQTGVAPDGSSRPVELGALISDESCLAPELAILAKDALRTSHARIETAIAAAQKHSQTERNWKILRSLYGLDRGELRRSTYAVAQMQQPPVTHQRVTQIINAIWKRVTKSGVPMTHKEFVKELARRKALAELVDCI